MKNFFKSALEGAYLLYDAPSWKEEQKLSSIKFFFPLPLCFAFSGIGVHLMLDFQSINEFFTTSPDWVKLIFGLLISAMAYPFFFKFIYPLLVVENIDKSEKSNKYIALVVYWAGCFIVMTLLGYVSNYTRADEFNWATGNW